MAGAFDEWAVARTPSLLRFAHALTEDGPVAETATEKALERTRRAWSDVEHGEDPDLLARRFLIDACPSRRRAAAVLRVLEDRSDAEIAEVLGTSHAFARAQVQRGLATLQDDLPEGADAAVGDHLHARASAAPTQLARPLATTDATPRRRGRAIWVPVVAVLALVATVAGVSRATRTAPGVITYPTVHAPADWRYESYDGVQVQVPATWGFGGAPLHADFLHGRLASCGANQAAVLSSADTATYVTSATPFVGRPSKLNDACVPWGSDGSTPTGTAVWFGSPLPVGVQERRARARRDADDRRPAPHGLRRGVGATTPDPRHRGDRGRRRERLPHACRPGADRGPGLVVADLAVGLCLLAGHRHDHADVVRPPLVAVGAGVRRRAAAGRRRGRRRAGDAGPACTSVPTGRWVALGLHGDSGTRWDVVDLRCGAIERPGGTVPLTPATVRDWARDGVTAYAVAPAGLPRSVAPYFHTGVG